MATSTPYFKFDKAREQFGEPIEQYRHFLYQMDPLADETVAALAALPAGRGAKFLQIALDEGIEAVPNAPDALKALFDQVDRVPFWVNWERMERGGRAFTRASIPVLLVVGLYSLPLMYSSPAGSKPLVSTKQLVDRAGLRLAETLVFVRRTCTPGELKRFGEGFKINLKVRLMHAQVRRLLLRSGRWDTEAWAMPINQAHMAGTLVAISAAVLIKLKELGFQFSQTEIDDILLLWRYSGYLSGVSEELTCSTLADAQQLYEVILAVEGDPDDDSKALIKALRDMPPVIEIPPKLKALGHAVGIKDLYAGLARTMLGEELADALAVPRANRTLIAPTLRSLLRATSWFQSSMPGGYALSEKLSKNVWGFAEGMLFKNASKKYTP